jgi:hypothetical protein
MARMLQLGSLALLLALAGGGCQRPAPVVAVNGKVTFKGANLPGGLIVFAPDASRGSKIREDGSYTLFTGSNEGASAGWYRVTVATLIPTHVSGDHLATPVSVVPDKYRDPALSLLTCEVKSDRVNQLDFNLD